MRGNILYFVVPCYNEEKNVSLFYEEFTKVFKKFKHVIFSSALISIVSFLIAFFIFTSFPFGASVVVVNLFFLITFSLVGLVTRKYAKL